MGTDKVEIDDIVEFKINMRWNVVYTGRGKVVAVYKNGNVDVNEDGHMRKILATECTVLSKGDA